MMARMVVVLAVVAGVGGDAEDERGLNAKVVAFARSRIGEKVGNGQCTSLVIGALGAAGARRFPDGPDDEDYVWGEYVEQPEDVRAGDVLQFRDVVFKSRRRVRRGARTVIRSETRFFPHHSAIVDEVREGGRIIVILHQNAGPGSMSEEERMTVKREALDMEDLQEGGWIKAYHPVGR